MKRLLFLFTVLILCAQTSTAQQIPAEIDALTKWNLIEAHSDTVGFALFTAEPADTLEIYYNLSGQPAAWLLTLSGARYGKTSIGPAFLIDDRLEEAYAVWKENRDILESLELLYMIREHVRK